jgi:hypothetical protein
MFHEEDSLLHCCMPHNPRRFRRIQRRMFRLDAATELV